MSPDGKLVVDASVVVKWYVPEPESPQAVELLESGSELFAPDLVVAEFGNTLWKKIRTGELGDDEAKNIVEAFLAAPPLKTRSSSLLLAGALDIAGRFKRTVYDALYLALAVVEGCVLVTADDKLVRAVRGTPLQPFVRSLARR